MTAKPLALKIALGYLLVVALLALAIALTLWQVGALNRSSEQLIELREPATQASLRIKSGINSATAALRALMLFPEDRYREQRRTVWAEEINPSLSRFEQLVSRWSEAAGIDDLPRLNSMLAELEQRQSQVETLAATDRNRALQILDGESIPLTVEINAMLDRVTDQQQRLLALEQESVARQITFLGNLEWVLLLLGVIGGASLSLFTARSITRPLAHAVTVADNIGQGNLETPVAVGGSRELEALGGALTQMRDALLAKTRDNERYNWLATGQNRLNEAMRGDKTPEELATSIVTFMANYSGANIASLYLLDDDGACLSLTGAYAFGSGSTQRNFRMGEGVIGQAAAENRPLSLDALDKDYIRIRSSLVDGPPTSVYVCPFSIEGKVFGVIELGKLKPFDNTERELIDLCLEAVGIALNSARARQRIQELLEETQQQSEELQQQQEELEQSNEELEEQAQHLKEQQEELQAANEELEEQTQLISEKNESLETARESIELKAQQLEISGKYKSDFLANMSHELRTPLNSLLILANDLAQNATGNLDAEQVESAQVIGKSGQDLLHLINDILDLSKVEAGKLSLNLAAVDLSKFVADLTRNFKRQAADKGLSLNISVDPQLPDILHTDRMRLEQILNNLISNALKFTDRGGIVIDLRPAPNEYLAIAVRDTGIGIAQDKLGAVFEAFVQADGGTSRKYGGTGLGLSISRELAKLLGGHLSAESEEGKGSTFTLTIPLTLAADPAQAAPQARVARANPLAAPGVNRFLNYPSITDQRHEIGAGDNSILIVEDDENFAQVLAGQCVAKGFKHINAATGEDALRLAAEYQPSAMILDLELPGMDGHMVLKELKSDPDLRHIPVHIISAQDKTLDPIRAGAIDYLTKPVSKEQLDSAFSRIEAFINRKMKSLLIVEDDAVMRKAVVKLIGNGDVECFEAGTGREALEFHRSHEVDCMVLDIGLPDMSGFEVIQALEKEQKDRMPPIVVYTGRELSKEENDELRQYAESVIVKGVKSEERLLDETALFLHRAVKNLPAHKRKVIARLYDEEEILQAKQVLVVDDDMRNVFALSKALTSRGMAVHKAENGLAALTLLQQQPDLDFVLMDIMMPEMDGYECMSRIRQHPEFADLPIIALTAKAMKDDRRKCIEAGANDYISKPVDIERLVSLMRVWMKK